MMNEVFSLLLNIIILYCKLYLVGVLLVSMIYMLRLLVKKYIKIDMDIEE